MNDHRDEFESQINDALSAITNAALQLPTVSKKHTKIDNVVRTLTDLKMEHKAERLGLTQD